MKLNLGSGPDIKPGYVNVDFRQMPGVDRVVDLSKIPWPFESDSCDEILMLDFLEHFPYRMTRAILNEAWRILKKDGDIIIQVPDFTHCSNAANGFVPFACNVCGQEFDSLVSIGLVCHKCGTRMCDIRLAAIHRLYGGQDYEGNWHHTAFTKQILEYELSICGFGNTRFFELNEKNETFWQNWNFKMSSKKIIGWSDE